MRRVIEVTIDSAIHRFSALRTTAGRTATVHAPPGDIDAFAVHIIKLAFEVAFVGNVVNAVGIMLRYPEAVTAGK